MTSAVDVLRPSDKRELPLASFQRERRRETDNGRKELRVWLVTDSWRPSGLGEHMLTLAGELRDRLSITLAAPALRGGHDLLDQAREAGLCVAPLRGRTEAARGADLRSRLRESPPDVLHVHAGVSWEGCSATLIARQSGCPVIIRTEHQPLRSVSERRRKRHADAFGAADQLICVSEANAASFISGGVPAPKISVIPNGVAVRDATMASTEVRRRLKLRSDAPVLLTVGRLARQKGYRYLLEATPRVLAEVPDVQLVWVGSGPQERQLRAAMDERRLSSNVHLLATRHNVWDLLGAAYALVLPSLWEGIPLVAIEAMAAGVPVVGTAVAGTSEVVRDGATGRLVPPRDPAALAAALIELLTSPGARARWGAGGRRRFQARFTAETMARRTALLYHELVGSTEAQHR